MKYVVAFVLCMSSVMMASPQRVYLGKDDVGWGNNQPCEFFQELWNYMLHGHGRHNKKWGYVDSNDPIPPDPTPTPNPNPDPTPNPDPIDPNPIPNPEPTPNPDPIPNPNPNPNPPPGTAPAPEPGTLLAIGASALVISLSKRLRRKNEVV